MIFSGTLADALVIGISPWLCITRCLVNWVIFSHCNAVCTKSLCLKKESCAFFLRYAAAHGQRMQNIFTTSVIHNLLALLALREEIYDLTSTVFIIVDRSCRAVIIADIIFIIVRRSCNTILSQKINIVDDVIVLFRAQAAA